MLMKWRKGHKTMHFVINLEKAFDKKSKNFWDRLRLAETLKCYVKVIKNVYDEATTTVRCAARLTDKF